MKSTDDADDLRLRRAVANARLLADELARRDSAGTWTQQVTIRTEFGGVGTSAPSAARQQFNNHRGRVAVVCWDLGHNPAGRAMMLADLHLESMRVDLVGPLWSRFSNKLWSPIEEGGYETVTFTCDRMIDFAAKAYSVAAHRKYDLVHICKARLPGLILGSMIARASDCPLIVDIDDEEQAFFADAEAFDLDVLEPALLHEPTEAYGTALGTSIARNASVRTVSNVELRARYGGIVVRHARSEVSFDPGSASRADGRARLGAAPDDFVVLFVGTPRPHKGLDIVVEALRLLDSRFVLHVVGVPNPARFRDEIDTSDIRVVTHPPTDIGILPELIAAGDAIALMQHLDDPISASQIPSKISDGLSMGCPVIVTDAPPLRDLQDHGLLRSDDAAQLAEHLESLANGEDDTARRNRRDAFLGEFSIAVNAARVRVAHREAKNLAAVGPNLVIATVLGVTSEAYLHERRVARPDLFGVADPAPDEGVDIVVFWKQNDTGIYGRRSDMLTKYFGEDPRVRRVLHFDAPLSTERAARDATLKTDGSDHSPLLSQTLLDRRLGIIESGKVHHRTYLYSDTGGHDPLTGELLGDQTGFADFVLQQMTELDMTPSASIAWVCPVAPGFLDVQTQLQFATVVADVIDDQRVSNHRREVAQQLDDAYRLTLGLSKLVFTNCHPNVDAFKAYSPGMIVVPNGAETKEFSGTRETVGIDDRPVVAYVGNMSDRVDWGLMNDLVEIRPDYRFLMVGSAHYGADVFDLVKRHENVELTGVVPYAQLPNLLSGVDVGLVPHLAGTMTERMNPLKVYNYIAAGLPVVSTPIPNMDELIDLIAVADNALGFALAIDAAIVQRRSGTMARPTERLQAIDWSTRAVTILDHLENANLLEP
jgi:glycosyltransferase involved in cell wall biosynthesis